MEHTSSVPLNREKRSPSFAFQPASDLGLSPDMPYTCSSTGGFFSIGRLGDGHVGLRRHTN